MWTERCAVTRRFYRRLSRTAAIRKAGWKPPGRKSTDCSRRGVPPNKQNLRYGRLPETEALRERGHAPRRLVKKRIFDKRKAAELLFRRPRALTKPTNAKIALIKEWTVPQATDREIKSLS